MTLIDAIEYYILSMRFGIENNKSENKNYRIRVKTISNLRIYFISQLRSNSCDSINFCVIDHKTNNYSTEGNKMRGTFTNTPDESTK